MKRKPIAAAWAVTAALCFLAAFGALFTGMKEARKILDQAEFNAKLAVHSCWSWQKPFRQSRQMIMPDLPK